MWNKLNKDLFKKWNLLNRNKTKNLKNNESNNNESYYIENDYVNEKALITLKNINLEFKEKRKKKIVFNNLNFTIYQNQIIAIIGSNGAGKTSLFEILTKIRKVNSGQVIYHENINKKDTNKYINMQSQDFIFPTGLIVKDIVEFILDLQNINLEKIKDEFLEMLDIFNLRKLWFEKASKLSGGQQQRLNLFISLLNHPKILLLDEYVTGLDIVSKTKIEDFLMKFIDKHNITLLFISHDLTGLTQLATRYIIIKSSDIVIDLTRQKVIEYFGSISNLIKKYIN